MSITRTPRQDCRIVIAVAVKPPDCIPSPDEDPAKSEFAFNYVDQKKDPVRVPCTAAIYQIAAGRFVRRKGHTGLKDARPSTFRLVLDARGLLIAVDTLLEQEVLHGMRRKDLEDVRSIRIEIMPEGFRVVRRPQEVTMQQLLDLLKALDPLAEISVGTQLGRFTILSAEGHILEIAPPEDDEDD